MKKSLKLLLILLTTLPIYAQHDMASMDEPKPVTLYTGLGILNHKVSTTNDVAQNYFNQGLTMIYAFNHFEAIRSFQKAAELDPNLAMAYWGIAYALGPNYNLDADENQRKQAYDAMQKAIELSANCTEQEKDYIMAISKRYSSDLKSDQSALNVEFKKAMGELSKKYPDDLDAATLYAESMMDLKPWQLWNKDGTPAEGTEEIVSVLESVLKRDPNHIGANHYYIHAVEASLDPGRGLNCAKILKTLVPAAGHLVHMPAHIFFRVGDYEDASEANRKAIIADQTYIKETNVTGIYSLMYYNHNLNFLTISCLMEGRFNESLNAARQVETNVSPFVKDMPMVEPIMSSPLWVLVAFHKWDEILNSPVPDSSLHLAGVFSHFARGMAYSSKGDEDNSRKELKLLMKDREKINPDATVGFSSSQIVTDITLNLLKGKIAEVKGESKKAIAFFINAVKDEESLKYDEPPDWYPSTRLYLAGALYSSGNFSESEKIFRDDLKKYPHNGWALFGLENCLMKEGKKDEAAGVMNEFNEAWKNADTKLNVEDY